MSRPNRNLNQNAIRTQPPQAPVPTTTTTKTTTTTMRSQQQRQSLLQPKHGALFLSSQSNKHGGLTSHREGSHEDRDEEDDNDNDNDNDHNEAYDAEHETSTLDTNHNDDPTTATSQWASSTIRSEGGTSVTTTTTTLPQTTTTMPLLPPLPLYPRQPRPMHPYNKPPTPYHHQSQSQSQSQLSQSHAQVPLRRQGPSNDDTNNISRGDSTHQSSYMSYGSTVATPYSTSSTTYQGSTISGGALSMSLAGDSILQPQPPKPQQPQQPQTHRTGMVSLADSTTTPGDESSSTPSSNPNIHSKNANNHNHHNNHNKTTNYSRTSSTPTTVSSLAVDEDLMARKKLGIPNNNNNNPRPSSPVIPPSSPWSTYYPSPRNNPNNNNQGDKGATAAQQPDTEKVPAPNTDHSNLLLHNVSNIKKRSTSSSSFFTANNNNSLSRKKNHSRSQETILSNEISNEKEQEDTLLMIKQVQQQKYREKQQQQQEQQQEHRVHWQNDGDDDLEHDKLLEEQTTITELISRTSSWDNRTDAAVKKSTSAATATTTNVSLPKSQVYHPPLFRTKSPPRGTDKKQSRPPLPKQRTPPPPLPPQVSHPIRSKPPLGGAAAAAAATPSIIKPIKSRSFPDLINMMVSGQSSPRLTPEDDNSLVAASPVVGVVTAAGGGGGTIQTAAAAASTQAATQQWQRSTLATAAAKPPIPKSKARHKSLSPPPPPKSRQGLIKGSTEQQNEQQQHRQEVQQQRSRSSSPITSPSRLNQPQHRKKQQKIHGQRQQEPQQPTAAKQNEVPLDMSLSTSAKRFVSTSSVDAVRQRTDLSLGTNESATTQPSSPYDLLPRPQRPGDSTNNNNAVSAADGELSNSKNNTTTRKKMDDAVSTTAIAVNESNRKKGGRGAKMMSGFSSKEAPTSEVANSLSPFRKMMGLRRRRRSEQTSPRWNSNKKDHRIPKDNNSTDQTQNTDTEIVFGPQDQTPMSRQSEITWNGPALWGQRTITNSPKENDSPETNSSVAVDESSSPQRQPPNISVATTSTVTTTRTNHAGRSTLPPSSPAVFPYRSPAARRRFLSSMDTVVEHQQQPQPHPSSSRDTATEKQQQQQQQHYSRGAQAKAADTGKAGTAPPRSGKQAKVPTGLAAAIPLVREGINTKESIAKSQKKGRLPGAVGHHSNENDETKDNQSSDSLGDADEESEEAEIVFEEESKEADNRGNLWNNMFLWEATNNYSDDDENDDLPELAAISSYENSPRAKQQKKKSPATLGSTKAKRRGMGKLLCTLSPDAILEDQAITFDEKDDPVIVIGGREREKQSSSTLSKTPLEVHQSSSTSPNDMEDEQPELPMNVKALLHEFDHRGGSFSSMDVLPSKNLPRSSGLDHSTATESNKSRQPPPLNVVSVVTEIPKRAKKAKAAPSKKTATSPCFASLVVPDDESETNRPQSAESLRRQSAESTLYGEDFVELRSAASNDSFLDMVFPSIVSRNDQMMNLLCGPTDRLESGEEPIKDRNLLLQQKKKKQAATVPSSEMSRTKNTPEKKSRPTLPLKAFGARDHPSRRRLAETNHDMEIDGTVLAGEEISRDDNTPIASPRRKLFLRKPGKEKRIIDDSLSLQVFHPTSIYDKKDGIPKRRKTGEDEMLKVNGYQGETVEEEPHSPSSPQSSEQGMVYAGGVKFVVSLETSPDHHEPPDLQLRKRMEPKSILNKEGAYGRGYYGGKGISTNMKMPPSNAAVGNNVGNIIRPVREFNPWENQSTMNMSPVQNQIDETPSTTFGSEPNGASSQSPKTKIAIVNIPNGLLPHDVHDGCDDYSYVEEGFEQTLSTVAPLYHQEEEKEEIGEAHEHGSPNRSSARNAVRDGPKDSYMPATTRSLEVKSDDGNQRRGFFGGWRKSKTDSPNSPIPRTTRIMADQSEGADENTIEISCSGSVDNQKAHGSKKQQRGGIRSIFKRRSATKKCDKKPGKGAPEDDDDDDDDGEKNRNNPAVQTMSTSSTSSIEHDETQMFFGGEMSITVETPRLEEDRIDQRLDPVEEAVHNSLSVQRPALSVISGDNTNGTQNEVMSPYIGNMGIPSRAQYFQEGEYEETSDSEVAYYANENDVVKDGANVRPNSKYSHFLEKYKQAATQETSNRKNGSKRKKGKAGHGGRNKKNGTAFVGGDAASRDEAVRRPPKTKSATAAMRSDPLLDEYTEVDAPSPLSKRLETAEDRLARRLKKDLELLNKIEKLRLERDTQHYYRDNRITRLDATAGVLREVQDFVRQQKAERAQQHQHHHHLIHATTIPSASSSCCTAPPHPAPRHHGLLAGSGSGYSSMSQRILVPQNAMVPRRGHSWTGGLFQCGTPATVLNEEPYYY
ncbi:hypothetical protein ACA910_006445 [Epithemia clementina (nom. ined.)]